MKLKLHLEELSVESFDTTAPEKARGTVFAEQCTCWTNCTCPGCPTCDNTCNNTCAYTCDDNTCLASCNGTCGASCDCSYDYSCQCTFEAAATCFNYGTCDPGRICREVP